MIKYSKCKHKTDGAVIMDCNELSMAGYLEWSESVGVFGDKTICWDCWSKGEEK